MDDKVVGRVEDSAGRRSVGNRHDQRDDRRDRAPDAAGVERGDIRAVVSDPQRCGRTAGHTPRVDEVGIGDSRHTWDVRHQVGLVVDIGRGGRARGRASRQGYRRQRSHGGKRTQQAESSTSAERRQPLHRTHRGHLNLHPCARPAPSCRPAAGLDPETPLSAIPSYAATNSSLVARNDHTTHSEASPTSPVYRITRLRRWSEHARSWRDTAPRSATKPAHALDEPRATRRVCAGRRRSRYRGAARCRRDPGTGSARRRRPLVMKGSPVRVRASASLKTREKPCKPWVPIGSKPCGPPAVSLADVRAADALSRLAGVAPNPCRAGCRLLRRLRC